MPSFEVHVPHDSEPTEVATRLRNFSERVRTQLSVQVTELVEQWDDRGNLKFSFRAIGFQVSGRMENRPRAVYVTGTIPFAALPFRGMIEKELESKIREALASPS